MIDRPAVQRLALKLGLEAAADWISKHPTQYTEGLVRRICGYGSGSIPLDRLCRNRSVAAAAVGVFLVIWRSLFFFQTSTAKKRRREYEIRLLKTESPEARPGSSACDTCQFGRLRV